MGVSLESLKIVPTQTLPFSFRCPFRFLESFRHYFPLASHLHTVKMKIWFAAIAAFAGIVAAAPTDVEKRQITANDLAGACKKITLIYARVS